MIVNFKYQGNGINFMEKNIAQLAGWRDIKLDQSVRIKASMMKVGSVL